MRSKNKNAFNFILCKMPCITFKGTSMLNDRPKTNRIDIMYKQVTWINMYFSHLFGGCRVNKTGNIAIESSFVIWLLILKGCERNNLHPVDSSPACSLQVAAISLHPPSFSCLPRLVELRPQLRQPSCCFVRVRSRADLLEWWWRWWFVGMRWGQILDWRRVVKRRIACSLAPSTDEKFKIVRTDVRGIDCQKVSGVRSIAV